MGLDWELLLFPIDQLTRSFQRFNFQVKDLGMPDEVLINGRVRIVIMPLLFHMARSHVAKPSQGMDGPARCPWRRGRLYLQSPGNTRGSSATTATSSKGRRK